MIECRFEYRGREDLDFCREFEINVGGEKWKGWKELIEKCEDGRRKRNKKNYRGKVRY